MRLDLACGRSVSAGFTGVDKEPFPGCIQHDLTVYPWPWDDKSVSQVWCSHYVEHVVDLVAFMNELYRVLKHTGTATIVHPYQHSDRAWQDPTHVRALNAVSWSYYNREWRQANGLDHYLGIDTDFTVSQIMYLCSPLNKGQWHNGGWTSRPTIEALTRVNMIDDLMVTLVAKHG